MLREFESHWLLRTFFPFQLVRLRNNEHNSTRKILMSTTHFSGFRMQLNRYGQLLNFGTRTFHIHEVIVFRKMKHLDMTSFFFAFKKTLLLQIYAAFLHSDFFPLFLFFCPAFLRQYIFQPSYKYMYKPTL